METLDINSLKIGDLQLEKGLVRKNVTMFAWDGIRECSNEDCPVSDLCHYAKRGKCAVQVKYLESLYKAILGTYSYLDDVMLFKIGMQVIPLYVQLVRLQLVELSLNSPIYTSNKGMEMAHPIYKEIRETLKTIHVMWKDLDLSFQFNSKPEMNPGKGSEKKADYEKGDPEYYKKISKEGKSKKGILR